ncbi:hypothetical protein LguiA_021831 [Lonicera macranthoides]
MTPWLTGSQRYNPLNGISGRHTVAPKGSTHSGLWMEVALSSSIFAVDQRSPSISAVDRRSLPSIADPRLRRWLRFQSEGVESLWSSISTVNRVIVEKVSSVLLRWRLDLQNEAVKMKDAIFKEGFEEVSTPATDKVRP